METRLLFAEKTKSGLTALWEGCLREKNMGQCVIITNESGEKPKATYVKIQNLTKHALIPVHVGYYVIQTKFKDGEFAHLISRVIKTEDEFVELELVNFFQNGRWFKQPDSSLSFAIATAQYKSMSSDKSKTLYAAWNWKEHLQKNKL